MEDYSSAKENKRYHQKVIFLKSMHYAYSLMLISPRIPARPAGLLEMRLAFKEKYPARPPNESEDS